MDREGTRFTIEGPREYIEIITAQHPNPNGRDLMNRLLELGQECNEIDYTASGNMAGLYRLEPMTCFYNAQRLATLREYHYVEGFALPFTGSKPGGVALIPVHHAWNMHQGRDVVVDATWASGHVPDMVRAVYFGVRIPKSYVLRARDEGRTGFDLLWTYLEEQEG